MNSNIYDSHNSGNSERHSIRPFPNTDGYILTDGERSELVFITQLMLNALTLYYDVNTVPISGIYDKATADSLKIFQRANRLPETGEVDFVTWDRLADEYNLTVNDSQ